MLKGPNYCKGDAPLVPIEIIKKGPQQIFGPGGEIKTKIMILNKEIITLTPGEASDTISHPTLPKIKFNLNLESVNEACIQK